MHCFYVKRQPICCYNTKSNIGVDIDELNSAPAEKRRLELGLKQKDVYMRIGLSRQLYQRLESKGNPRLNALKLIAQGLNSELILIPKEKAQAVKELLEKPEERLSEKGSVSGEQSKSLDEDPWQNLLEVDHEE